MEQNKTPETIYTHEETLYTTKVASQSTRMVGPGQPVIHVGEKRNQIFFPSPALKIKDLNVKSKCLQLLEENVGKISYIRYKHTIK